jgi:hypothetical protein
MFQSLYSSRPALTLMLFTLLEYHLLVVLPLWVLSVTFHYLLPLAIAVLLLPTIVCVAAGAQAELPSNKKRWWSRPLVALLFFLQPIVRGWARRVGRLQLRAADESSRETLESATLGDSGEPLGEVQYWDQQRMGRVQFVAGVIEELDRKGWPHRTDIGWSEFDVEIYGNPWSTLQLTTVSEDHARGQIIRCRLRTRWSLRARAAFWLLVGLDALAIGLFRSWSNWIGLLLLTLPALAWYLWRQKRALKSVVIVFLDELAKRKGLVKFQGSASDRR